MTQRIVVFDGKAYALNEAAAYTPPLPMIDQPPARLSLSDLPFAYGLPISEASLVKEDRAEEILDLGRLILNGAEIAKRRADADKVRRS